jgi:hypothetical protein
MFIEVLSAQPGHVVVLATSYPLLSEEPQVMDVGEQGLLNQPDSPESRISWSE